MPPNFEIIFDKVILTQLKKLGKNQEIKKRLSKMLDRIEDFGPRAGKLLDPKLNIYEIKSKRPPIRLYFRHVKKSGQIYVFEYELKTSTTKQRATIKKIKEK